MRQEYQIIKPEYDSDIYTKIKNIPEIEQDFDINRVLSYEVENKKIKIFADIFKRWVFSYDGNTKVTRIELKENTELLKYFKSLKDKFKDNEEVYLSDLERIIKELKILIESKKPNKIKEITKSKTTLKIGTLLNTCWGYDQTNTEFFRVVKILGKNYFIIQEITQETVKDSEGFMCCEVTAGNRDLNKVPIKAFISNDGYMSICEGGYKRGLSIIEKGEKQYKSWYA